MRSSARRAGLFAKSLPLPRLGEVLFLATLFFALALQAQPSRTLPARDDPGARVNQVAFKGDGQTMQVEIQTSMPILPQSQSLASPDRIVVDFPGAVPAAQLRSMQLNYGPLKAIRTGLFSANPPITRVVLDLAGPQPYQIVTSESTVTLKFRLPSIAGQSSTARTSSDGVASAEDNAVSGTAPTIPIVPPAPAFSVSFQQGLLQIHAQRATLAEVLFEVQKKTGAEIPIPSGAEQEMVAADLGPASPRDVLAALLTGSRYNFVFIDNERDHSLQKAILSLR
jgi:AMIN domain-containing protein